MRCIVHDLFDGDRFHLFGLIKISIVQQGQKKAFHFVSLFCFIWALRGNAESSVRSIADVSSTLCLLYKEKYV